MTELDLDILEGVYGYTVNKDALTTIGSRTTPLPVPSTVVLLALGMVLLPAAARRRRLPSV